MEQQLMMELLVFYSNYFPEKTVINLINETGEKNWILLMVKMAHFTRELDPLAALSRQNDDVIIDDSKVRTIAVQNVFLLWSKKYFYKL